mmetsp:Transcript_10538/g.64664  ORF Transcript_10538/g.64664 Transcript_10538/m.64664 type:complete len:462 (+) Transcript_10538:695-2080(+)
MSRGRGRAANERVDGGYRDRARERREGAVVDGSRTFGLDFQQLRRAREALARGRGCEAKDDATRDASQARAEAEGQVEARDRSATKAREAFVSRRGSALAHEDVNERLKKATGEREAWAKTRRPPWDLLLSARANSETKRHRAPTSPIPARAKADATQDTSPIAADAPATAATERTKAAQDRRTSRFRSQVEEGSIPAARAHPTNATSTEAVPSIHEHSRKHPSMHGPRHPTKQAENETSDDEDIFEGIGRGESMEPQEGVPDVGILAAYSSSEESNGGEDHPESDRGVVGPSLPSHDYAMYPSPEELEEPPASEPEEDEHDSAGSPLPPAPIPVSKEALRALQLERRTTGGAGKRAEEPRWKVKRSREELLKELEGNLEEGEYDALEDAAEEEEEEKTKKKTNEEEEEDEKAAKAKFKEKKKAKLNQEYQKIQSLLQRKEETQEGFRIKVQGTDGQKHSQ